MRADAAMLEEEAGEGTGTGITAAATSVMD